MAPNFQPSNVTSEEKKDDVEHTIRSIKDAEDSEVATFCRILDERASEASRKPSGTGWSKDEMEPQMFPYTRNGRLQLYSANRRWIGLNKGWSRVGGDEGGNQFSKRTRRSSQMKSLLGASELSALTLEKKEEFLHNEAQSCRSLIAQLCEQYYKWGWATGTAGGVSIRVGGPKENRPWRVFVAPSGIQKEDMIGDDVFELDMNENVVHGPKTEGLKLSACTPIWYLIYKHRPSAMSIIHTHSMHSQLATLLDPSEKSKTLRLTHLEMVKGVGGHAYDDVLEIPILDNRPSEDMLAPQMEKALKEYPKCNAVLVRRHGLFVWGDSWEQAKTQAESFDYLFETAIGMRRIGVDFSAIPSHGTYRTDDTKRYPSTTSTKRLAPLATEAPPTKRVRTSTPSEWNASSDANNQADLFTNKVPLLPRDYKYLLLDIEGCTTAISFVKDILFPYVLEHAETYIAKNLSPDRQRALWEALKADLTVEQFREAMVDTSENNPAALIKYMVRSDLKIASLKSFQGEMWKDGYKNGTLKGHVYEDFVPMLDWMKKYGVKVYIYSSGSVQAQKLLFGNSVVGDVTSYFAGHFDITTSGNKKKTDSYRNISKDLGADPSEIVFCSDALAELEAASAAGIGKCVMTVRPGNAPLNKEASELYPRVFSLLQLCGGGL